jgi:hypothetical protein
MLFTEQLETEL